MKTLKISCLIDKTKIKNDAPRDYIGASSIGDECERKIWYEFNKVKGIEPENKIKRTWEIGKILESKVLDWVEQAGLKLVRKYKDLVDSDFDYFRGHVDSVLVDKNNNPFAILEIKTAKDAIFNVFVKKGLRLWYPVYFAQLQAYMGMSGIPESYILVLNKDTSQLSDEHVLFDEMYYEGLRYKARIIKETLKIPDRVSDSPLWFKCKMCKFREVCHD